MMQILKFSAKTSAKVQFEIETGAIIFGRFHIKLLY